jgi:redox-sensitive bicupin YhaK (pirin superfamily)
MHQDASLSRLRLAPGEEFTLDTHGRTGYLHFIDGSTRIGGDTFSEGDGIGFIKTREQSVIAGSDGVEALWFDLPKNG